MNRNWYIFLVVWILIVSFGPVTLLLNAPLSSIFSSSFGTINFFQRLAGLILFSLIFVQVVLGALMPRWTELLTGKIFKFHIVEGIAAYFLMILHIIFGTLLGFGFLPVFARSQLLYNFGRFAFLLFTVAVLAGLLRTKPFLIRHWRKFHILNYLAFYLIAIHSFFVGSDTRSFPFIVLWWIAVFVVTFLVLRKLSNGTFFARI